MSTTEKGGKGVNLTPYGKQIKIRLIELDKPQTWLIEQVRERTGLYCDSSLLYKLSTGQLNVPKIRAAVDEILGLEEKGA
ncbi:XRE family transcriptional regulator [Dysosmobacter sp. Marseille-Q4140]|nr:XRE family transcriptional regulator [Dysosmobacter sp. Marseille-Q4140]